jgi:transmembrane sensor
MNNNEDYIRQLLSKYISGQCVENELETLFVNLAVPTGKVILADVLDQESASVFETEGALDPARSNRILAQIRESMEASESFEIRIVPLLKRAFLWKVAVSVLLIVFGAGFGYKYFRHNERMIVKTGESQKRSLFLPDGSRVILNFNSTLTYDKNWAGQESREVTLEGEAFFDVVHDKKHPFYVKTERMEIKVIGTAFNVKSDEVKNIFETTLVRGKVTIRDLKAPDAAATVLIPNEQAVFSKEHKRIQTAVFTPDENSYWEKGKLVFEDEPVGVIARELEKWYGVKIELEEASENCLFSLNVDEETLQEVLGLFESVTGVESVVAGRNVLIKGKLCDEIQTKLP